MSKIVEIWSAGLGVVSLHCFQSVIPVEAYTREACMVDALGRFGLIKYCRFRNFFLIFILRIFNFRIIASS